MSERTPTSTVPAPLRAVGALLSFATALVMVPVGIYTAFTLEPGAFYLILAVGGLCAFANGVWITKGLLREHAARS